MVRIQFHDAALLGAAAFAFLQQALQVRTYSCSSVTGMPANPPGELEHAYLFNVFIQLLWQASRKLLYLPLSA